MNCSGTTGERNPRQASLKIEKVVNPDTGSMT